MTGVHVDTTTIDTNKTPKNHSSTTCARAAPAAAPAPRQFKLNPRANEFIPAAMRAAAAPQVRRKRHEPRCKDAAQLQGPAVSGDARSGSLKPSRRPPRTTLKNPTGLSAGTNPEEANSNPRLGGAQDRQARRLANPDSRSSSANPAAPHVLYEYEYGLPAAAGNGPACCSPSLAELPGEVLACIMSKLENPRDVVSFSTASRLVRAVAKTAPLRLVLSNGLGTACQPLEFDGPRSAAILGGICAAFSGTRHLDLQGCAVSDGDVAPLLSLLPRLDSLQLSGCKKLTAGAVAAILPATKHNLPLATLAMQRCFQLNAGALDDILCFAAICGGGLRRVALSHLTLARWPARASALPVCTGLQVLALNNCSTLTESGIQALGKSCPRLEQLFLGGSLLLPDTAETPGATGVSAECKTRAGQVLAGLVSSLRSLKVLELTFFPALALEHLRGAGVLVPHSSASLLDFCNHDLSAAAGMGSCPALAGAVNCSNAVRQSPLHVAADLGNGNAPALLRLGAAIDTRDRSGATPLFVACYHGRAGVADELLKAGADPTRANSAGETPLYIASLRGHLHAAAVLLRHLRHKGILWEDGQSYADGWTPLMAATVGDHFAVALELLTAAGPLASKLVGATNRYGQTALHLVARRGSMQLLQAMLRAGGTAAVRVVDNSGLTAADVAGRQGHPQLQRAILQAA